MTALALRDDQTEWDIRQRDVLRSMGIGDEVQPGELLAFLHEAQQRRLDPFTRQIYLIGRHDKTAKRKVYRSQTGIDGFRLIARRAADKAGETIEYEDTIWFDTAGREHKVWLAKDPPAACRVTVLRGGRRFPAIARWSSYVQLNNDGYPTTLWAKMPDGQLEKCCEAKALRKAFPEELGGIYTDDEMGQADNPQRVTATAEVIKDEPPAIEDGAAWLEQAIGQAEHLKSEHAAGQLWRESAEKARGGQITPADAQNLQELIGNRVTHIRLKTFDDAMNLLSEDEPWRAKIDELAAAEDADTALAELDEADLDRRRDQRIRRAITALARLKGWRNGDEGGGS